MIKKLTACILLTVMVMSSVALAAVPAGHWFEGSIEAAAEIYPNVTNEEFNPDGLVTYSQFAAIATTATGRAIAYPTDKTEEYITRCDALEIICERLNYKYNLTEEEELTAALAMADFNDMPQQYKQTALLSVNKGLIKGDENGNVNMGDPISYAEVLTVFIRADHK